MALSEGVLSEALPGKWLISSHSGFRGNQRHCGLNLTKQNPDEMSHYFHVRRACLESWALSWLRLATLVLVICLKCYRWQSKVAFFLNDIRELKWVLCFDILGLSESPQTRTCLISSSWSDASLHAISLRNIIFNSIFICLESHLCHLKLLTQSLYSPTSPCLS